MKKILFMIVLLSLPAFFYCQNHLSDADPTPGAVTDEELIQPVTLVEFTAAVSPSQEVTITWITQSESSLSHYNLYRDGVWLQWENAVNSLVPHTYQYIDQDVRSEGLYSYLLEAVELDGRVTAYGPYLLQVVFHDDTVSSDMPAVTALHGNFPNPFNPSTIINFTIKDGERGELVISNSRGRILLTESFEAGTYEYHWDAMDLESGIYFYRLQTGSYLGVRKMIILQ